MLENDPLWYKDAIVYELHVRAFHDSAGVGMGDFKGLTQKIDYLADLGVTAVWLLPFYPSPLKDDGYDIADYTDLHPHYGKLRDFQEFLEAAHQRGIRVITELVINHTSEQHPWFQRARRAPAGSPERDFYVWSNTPDRYREARIIFKDFEHSNWAYDPLAKAYYWHRFYSHQPDLNYDNPAVWNALFPVVDFWLGMGVDGMRLDAVPYLYEREGTNCENLPETHAFLKALRKHVDQKFPNRMLLAEANQWPEDAVAYFGAGDECHMAFHFPVMPRMFMAIHMEDRFPIIDILAQTPTVPDNCQWGLFLRNHDELTLEMVTDEERDYMYRAYATDPRARINLGIRRRLAPLLGNDRSRIELMNGLLFSLPGTPVIYYGDEIGMGDNIYLGDRNGVRTPMQWSADRNAGFSRGNPQKLYLPVIIDPEYHYEAVNVEAQQNNPNSLLWWMKRLIALRKRYKAFGRGALEFLHPANRKILAFLRRYQEETILVVANLSRFVQYVELDMGRFQGLVPVEMFGRNPFPRIGELPYLLTLAPHSFYWFTLEHEESARGGDLRATPEVRFPSLRVRGGWEDLLRGPGKSRLEELLPGHLRQRQWFGARVRGVKSVTVRDSFRLRYADATAHILLLEVECREGSPEMYVLPVTYAEGEPAERVQRDYPPAVVARVHTGEGEGALADAVADPRFATALLEAIRAGKSWTVAGGELVATAFDPLGKVEGLDGAHLAPTVWRGHPRTTTVAFGDKLVLKVFRRVEEGVNPEVEVGRYLVERAGFGHTAPVLGVIEYVGRHSEPVTLAMLQAYVPNEGTAWQYTLDELSRYFERVAALPAAEQKAPESAGSLLDLSAVAVPGAVEELVGRYLDTARLLGERTAQLHLALAADGEDGAFTPEPFTTLYQRSLYQSMRNLKRRVFDQLRQHVEELPEEVRPLAREVLEGEEGVHQRFRAVLERKVVAQRTRYHGDYHLGKLLYTGKDFVVIDLEGEPSRSIGDRRLKRSPLRDVAGMVRSFHYAAAIALLGERDRRGHPTGVIRPEDVWVLAPWARAWYVWVSAVYLRAYLHAAGGAGFLPGSPDMLRALFDALLLEKALTELSGELMHNPERAVIPLRAVQHILESGA
jgi:maltose alpha-D-glucosyltransferase / alpha-amylase